VAACMHYKNEVNPYTWSLICSKEEIPEFSSLLILPLPRIATLLAVIFHRRNRFRCRKNSYSDLVK
jgi:hypothetical protein